MVILMFPSSMSCPPGGKPSGSLPVESKTRGHRILKQRSKRTTSYGLSADRKSSKMDYKNLMEGFEHLQEMFLRPDHEAAIVHGRTKPEEKSTKCNALRKASILVAPGDRWAVPTSVMLIESCERFGLSQLHQLRGRVGRGADQSYCILMSGEQLSNEARRRIEIMVRTEDGFEIAEEDLKLRGPGDLLGTRQSGSLELKLASLIHDGPLLQLRTPKNFGLRPKPRSISWVRLTIENDTVKSESAESR